MKIANYYKLFFICFLLVLSNGCAPYYAHKVGPTDIMKAREEIREDQLLDVGIQVFESNRITEKQTKEEHTSPEVRKAESHFIPYHLKNTLQQSSYWGAVRVFPTETESIDVRVNGKILESNGEILALQVDVADATGKRWFTKKYKSQATPDFYSGNLMGGKDAFQDIYNAISNDMAQYFKNLPPEKIKAIRTVSKLKFAEHFAPSAFGGYLATDEDNIITVNRLPADEDPIMIRLLKIRERENMYLDTLNAYYAQYYSEMWPSYENWRKLNYQEIQAIKKIKQDATIHKIVGGLLIAGAIALGASDVNNTGALQVGMVLVGGQVIVQGFNITKQAEIHSEAIKELSESFGSEMRPIVMEFEGQQVELTGSAEEQFKRWRELLEKIYLLETGFDPDVSPETRENTKTQDLE